MTRSSTKREVLPGQDHTRQPRAATQLLTLFQGTLFASQHRCEEGIGNSFAHAAHGRPRRGPAALCGAGDPTVCLVCPCPPFGGAPGALALAAIVPVGASAAHVVVLQVAEGAARRTQRQLCGLLPDDHAYSRPLGDIPGRGTIPLHAWGIFPVAGLFPTPG